MLSRDLLRQKAKKIYKENVKNIPKNKRITFATFFKQYKNLSNSEQAAEAKTTEPKPEAEDFNFENLVNVSEINDESLEPANKTTEDQNEQ